MRTSLVLCSLVVCLHADQLVLKNGDRVTGSIVKKDDKTITIKSDLFGVITAPWDQVVSVTADKPVTVVLKEREDVHGTVTTQGEMVRVADVEVPRADVLAIRNGDEQLNYERLLHPGFFQLWKTTSTLGFAGTAGNAKTTTFTTGFNATRATRSDKLTVNFSTIVASAVVNGKSDETARSVRSGISYDHNVSSRLFVNGFNGFEYDAFQNLDLRSTLGGGFGVHAVKNGRSKLDFLGGGDYNHESFATLTRKAGEFFWGDDYNFALSKSVSLVQAFRMFNNLSNTGEYRVNGDLGISFKLTRWLNWNTSLSDRFLSNPVAGRKRNDFLYTAGLGVTFAQ
jgi:Protein of unknown function, DUF481